MFEAFIVIFAAALSPSLTMFSLLVSRPEAKSKLPGLSLIQEASQKDQEGVREIAQRQTLPSAPVVIQMLQKVCRYQQQAHQKKLRSKICCSYILRFFVYKRCPGCKYPHFVPCCLSMLRVLAAHQLGFWTILYSGFLRNMKLAKMLQCFAKLSQVSRVLQDQIFTIFVFRESDKFPETREIKLIIQNGTTQRLKIQEKQRITSVFTQLGRKSLEH